MLQFTRNHHQNKYQIILHKTEKKNFMQKKRYNITLEQATKAQRAEKRYSYTLSLTSALHADGCSTPRLVLLPPGKSRYPLHRRLGGPQDRSEQMRIISPRTGIRLPDPPARSETLYRLSYPDPQMLCNTVWYLFPDDDSMWTETYRNTQCYDIIRIPTEEDSILLVSAVNWLSTTHGTNSIKLIHVVLKNLQSNFAIGVKEARPVGTVHACKSGYLPQILEP